MNCNNHKNLGQLNIYDKHKGNKDHNKGIKGVPLHSVVCYHGGNGVTEREYVCHCVVCYCVVWRGVSWCVVVCCVVEATVAI